MKAKIVKLNLHQIKKRSRGKEIKYKLVTIQIKYGLKRSNQGLEV